MDLACCIMDAKLGAMHLDDLGRPYYLYKGKQVKRVVYYHDEYSFECEPEVAEEVKKMAQSRVTGNDTKKVHERVCAQLLQRVSSTRKAFLEGNG